MAAQLSASLLSLQLPTLLHNGLLEGRVVEELELPLGSPPGLSLPYLLHSLPLNRH